MRRTVCGFTLIELLVVLAIIAILALLAAPSYHGKIIRDQIVEAAPLADIAKKRIAATWDATEALPADNAEAGLPPPEKMVSNVVSSVRVEGGAVHVTFGNRASSALQGRILTFRPGIVADEPVVPVAWVCGHAQAPGPMTAVGENRTDIDEAYLPVNCRPGKPG
jgi:type IV pilus assembly protein PilA